MLNKITLRNLILGGWPLPSGTISVLGGLAMALAAPPVGLWPLAWVAMVPLWLKALGDRSSSAQHQLERLPLSQSSASQSSASQSSVSVGLLWGATYHGITLHWIWSLHPLTWMGIPWLVSLLIAGGCWLLLTLWGALQAVLWTVGMRQLRVCLQRWRFQVGVGGWIWIGMTLWCLIDLLWSWSDLYWNPLAYTQSPHNRAILHLAQLAGPTAITAAIVASNGLLAALSLSSTTVRPKSLAWRRYGVAVAILWLLSHSLGGILAAQSPPDPPTTGLPVGIIQGNIPTREKLFSEGLQRSIDRYTLGYRQLVAQGAAAVLMPEGALPWIWGGFSGREEPLQQAIAQFGKPAWVGTFVEQEGVGSAVSTQSLINVMPNGDQITGRYNKVKLVPLGEYIPFEPLIGQWIDRLSPMLGSLAFGEVGQRFITPWGQAAVAICYEPAFSELLRLQVAAGAEFILTSSNLDPYGTALMAQHEALDVIRAIESDRWLVRAANTGYSGIINPQGQVLWRSPPNQFVTHLVTMHRRTSQTLYIRWGNWLVPCFILGSGLLLAYPEK